MTAYIHRVDRVKGITPATQARRRPGRTRRDAPEASLLADNLAEDAARLWDARWSPWYGGTGGPLVGGASRKTLQERIGLLGVVLVHGLRASTPADAAWSISLKCTDDGAPLALLMAKEDDEESVPVRLERRSLLIGGRRVFLAGSGATMSALRALAAEMGAYFGAPVRASA